MSWVIIIDDICDEILDDINKIIFLYCIIIDILGK